MYRFIIISFTSILTLSFCFQIVTAQVAKINQDNNPLNSTLQNISVTGFGDFLSIIDNEDDRQMFEIGQAELGFEFPFSDNSLFSLSVAYDGEAFGIGTFYYEQSFVKKQSPLSYSLGIGQFDVPFGIDWHVYSSIDRNLITAPLIISETHSGWNDLGVNFNIDHQRFNSSLFIINGFSHECYDVNDELITIQSNYAIGSRQAITFSSTLEIGGSFAYVDGYDTSYDMFLYGADLQYSLNNLSLKSEVIKHTFQTDTNVKLHDNGFYIQTKYDFNRFYLVSRVSSFHHVDEDYKYQYSSGFGVNFEHNVIGRMEWLHDSETKSDQVFLQLALGF